MTEKRALQSYPTVPIALWLGYCRLVPFVALATLMGLPVPERRPVESL